MPVLPVLPSTVRVQRDASHEGGRGGGGEAERGACDGYGFGQSSSAQRLRDAVLGAGPASPDFTDGYEAQRVVHAAVQGAASGRWVRL